MPNRAGLSKTPLRLLTALIVQSPLLPMLAAGGIPEAGCLSRLPLYPVDVVDADRDGVSRECGRCGCTRRCCTSTQLAICNTPAAVTASFSSRSSFSIALSNLASSNHRLQ